LCPYKDDAQIDMKTMNRNDTKGAALLSGDKENRVFSFSESSDTGLYTIPHARLVVHITEWKQHGL